ncbi:hypothetical protein EMWEY_00056040 [Eimeria maxima]|uniref:Secreted protein n=1 Tax=Eimeria maxima TaxID=5804 RepID=U6MBZ0_EIMMA|nr:hypothetical protein EMWEY_00056040 [Eimeria maxima]CDJ59180.1 hypothetical protein EMWEY_00056040 [Eimeria maxima]
MKGRRVVVLPFRVLPTQCWKCLLLCLVAFEHFSMATQDGISFYFCWRKYARRVTLEFIAFADIENIHFFEDVYKQAV